MKHLRTLFSFLVAVALSSPVFADGTTASALAGSSADANATGAIFNPVSGANSSSGSSISGVNLGGGAGGSAAVNMQNDLSLYSNPSYIGGSTNATIGDTTATIGNTTATIGNTQASTGAIDITQTFEATKQRSLLPGAVPAPVGSPQFFGNPTTPANAASVPLEWYVAKQSEIALSKGDRMEVAYHDGHGVQMTLTTLPAYYKIGGGESRSSSWDGDNGLWYVNGVASNSDGKGSVRLLLNGSGKFRVLATLLVVANPENAGRVNLSVLRAEAMNYARGLLPNTDVVLASYARTIAQSAGVASNSSARSLAPLLSGFAGGGVGAALGLSTAFGGNEGVVHSSGQLGVTYVVLMKDPAGVELTAAGVEGAYRGFQSESADAGGNGKKLEAVKQ